MASSNSQQSNFNNTSMDKQALLAVLKFLKQNNLHDTENLLKKEANLSSSDGESSSAAPSDVTQALSSYKSEGDPSLYADYYRALKKFVDGSLDIHKCELSLVLYPVFVHMYLELVFNRHQEEAVRFFEDFSRDQEYYYEEDLNQLSLVRKPEHMNGNQLLENFKTGKFTIRMSRDSYNHLKRHLLENKQNILLNIVQEHLFVDVFDGVPRTAKQIEAVGGAMLGEAKKEANKQKIYFGLLKEPDINVPLEEDEEDAETERPKKKKSRKDPNLLKKAKNDPNAPPLTRIPLPEWRDLDKLEKIRTIRESRKKVDIGPDQLPSVCFYTFLNTYQGVTSIDISDDSSLMTAGFSDSQIRVFSLTPEKLRTMKPPDDLNIIDKDADDVLVRMMDERTSTEWKSLYGHSGPLTSVSFSPDRCSMVSSAEDGTARLWSLQTWANLVCYKGHMYPVWATQFGPYGHYFVTGGFDRTARLWSTNHYQPVRIFAGHLADVDAVRFHPNSNYVATGSTDRTVRLWDVNSGNCVRIMSGHKGSVQSLTFSPDGKYLVSSGVDKTVLMWDVATGEMVGCLKGHTDSVYTLEYSREGSLLASGGLDNVVKLWDVNKVLEDQQDCEVVPGLNNSAPYLAANYSTKSTPVFKLHFTRRNLLLGTGAFVS